MLDVRSAFSRWLGRAGQAKVPPAVVPASPTSRVNNYPAPRAKGEWWGSRFLCALGLRGTRVPAFHRPFNSALEKSRTVQPNPSCLKLAERPHQGGKADGVSQQARDVLRCRESEASRNPVKHYPRSNERCQEQIRLYITTPYTLHAEAVRAVYSAATLSRVLPANPCRGAHSV